MSRSRIYLNTLISAFNLHKWFVKNTRKWLLLGEVPNSYWPHGPPASACEGEACMAL